MRRIGFRSRPEAGEEGGEVVAAGTPEASGEDQRSHTGRYLRRALRAQALSFQVREGSRNEPWKVTQRDFSTALAPPAGNGELARAAETAPRFHYEWS